MDVRGAGGITDLCDTLLNFWRTRNIKRLSRKARTTLTYSTVLERSSPARNNAMESGKVRHGYASTRSRCSSPSPRAYR